MAFPEISTYLSSGDTASVERWTPPVRMLMERHPELHQVDLVIEGAIGRGQTMPHVIRALFPDALYVGTDLARLMFSKPRLTGGVPEEELEKIFRANKHPTIPMDGAIILANCFDSALINDIAQQTNTHYPTLVAWRALNAFLNNELNGEEKKSRHDRTTLEDIVHPASPYRAQLYLMEYPLDEVNADIRVSFVNAYQQLGVLAKEKGWTVDHQEDWLLLVR